MLYTMMKAERNSQVALTSGVKSSITARGEFLAAMVGFGVDMYQQDIRFMCEKQLC